MPAILEHLVAALATRVVAIAEVAGEDHVLRRVTVTDTAVDPRRTRGCARRAGSGSRVSCRLAFRSSATGRTAAAGSCVRTLAGSLRALKQAAVNQDRIVGARPQLMAGTGNATYGAVKGDFHLRSLASVRSYDADLTAERRELPGPWVAFSHELSPGGA